MDPGHVPEGSPHARSDHLPAAFRLHPARDGPRAALTVAACDSSVTPSASTRPPPASRPRAPVRRRRADAHAVRGEPSPTPSAEPSVVPVSGDFAPGALAVTVSPTACGCAPQPRVDDASIQYAPRAAGRHASSRSSRGRSEGSRLPRGTASPPSGSPWTAASTDGWVAVADHDGTPWVALADDPTPGLAVAAVGSRPRLAGARRRRRSARPRPSSASALALYRRLLTAGSGSPTRASSCRLRASRSALAMARAGATGDDRDPDGPRAACGRLGRSRRRAWDRSSRSSGHDATLAGRARAGDARPVPAHGQHARSPRTGWTIEQAYLDRIAERSGQASALVDYIDDPDAARDAINGWVAADARPDPEAARADGRDRRHAARRSSTRSTSRRTGRTSSTDRHRRIAAFSRRRRIRPTKVPTMELCG